MIITDLNRRYDVYIGIHAYGYYIAMHLPTGICILYVRLCSVHIGSYVSVDHFNVNHKQLLLKG